MGEYEIPHLIEQGVVRGLGDASGDLLGHCCGVYDTGEIPCRPLVQRVEAASSGGQVGLGGCPLVEGNVPVTEEARG